MTSMASYSFACAQAQEKAAADAEAAQATLQAAQEKANSNKARADEAEQSLAAESAARSEGNRKFNELEVCKALTMFTANAQSCVKKVIAATLLVLFGYGVWLVQLVTGHFMCKTPFFLAETVLADNVWRGASADLS